MILTADKHCTDYMIVDEDGKEIRGVITYDTDTRVAVRYLFDENGKIRTVDGRRLTEQVILRRSRAVKTPLEIHRSRPIE